jgi:hypothetical protein
MMAVTYPLLHHMHGPLPETVHYVVYTQQADEDICQVEQNERKHCTHGRGENITFETHKRAVAAQKWRTRITYT